ncbi:hypothetical protein [Desulfitobacterium chlororespirans]|uniref:Uncharacterized protein n=1 Tax=Desulfitobacterium chlororespirans DSM 11544 TaxID=1121395 RepID=A0A1M7U3N8_9FIRM|nr:hypothetical protein [Desulfitobacterium chlororespirans]SHN77490.1 hypothetical protein SAMN02745215_02893 [Desulfitobacterium chlororespirans DSM 11544]
MKAKTIKAILAKKHKDFVASIQDEEVRKLVDKNSIITGGSIVSMLLGEKVNDFDYYFTNKETCLAVARYYVEQFNQKTQKGVAVQELENSRIRVFVSSAGIAAEDEESEELTTEFDDEGMEELGLQELKEAQSEEKPSYRPVFLSSNAITLTNKVQLVIRFYGNAEEIHTNYDFVHATCYWTSKDNNLVLSGKALEAILAKELVYQGSKYPLASIMRTKKFIQRGWQINAGQYLKMVLQLQELNLHDINVLEEQLTGVDSAYFAMALTAVKKRVEEDPEFKVDNCYLFEVINRIF